MNRFNCEDCVLNGTDACRYGANKSNDYSDICPDLFVEQNHAYEKAIDECIETLGNDYWNIAKLEMLKNSELKEKK